KDASVRRVGHYVVRDVIGRKGRCTVRGSDSPRAFTHVCQKMNICAYVDCSMSRRCRPEALFKLLPWRRCRR
ncbi:hypothetical protein SPRG_19942, partial [Saprolegnia parasitica CBS 223.65]